MINNLLKLENDAHLFSNPHTFHFSTNSTKISIEYEVTNILKGSFPQICPVNQKGLELLYKKDSKWKNFPVDSNKEIINVDSSEFIIYGPLISNLTQLKIITSKNHPIKLIENKKNMLVAGGLHSFGIGSDSVRTMFSNLISRENNLDIYRFTFDDVNYLKLVFESLQKLDDGISFDYGLLELDYYLQNDKIVNRYLFNVIRLMLKRCKYLICWYCIPPYKKYKINNLFRFIEPFLNGNNMIIEDLSFLYNNDNVDMCTQSNNYISSSGNYLIYKSLNNYFSGER